MLENCRTAIEFGGSSRLQLPVTLFDRLVVSFAIPEIFIHQPTISNPGKIKMFKTTHQCIEIHIDRCSGTQSDLSSEMWSAMAPAHTDEIPVETVGPLRLPSGRKQQS